MVIGLRCVSLGRVELGWLGLDWVGWVGWVGLNWVALVALCCFHHPIPEKKKDKAETVLIEDY